MNFDTLLANALAKKSKEDFVLAISVATEKRDFERLMAHASSFGLISMAEEAASQKGFGLIPRSLHFAGDGLNPLRLQF